MLKAEQSYYEAIVKMQEQKASQPLFQLVASDKDKPIIMQNVQSFTVFAPPQGENGPRLNQYVQKDYVQPWLNVLGSFAPWLGAWGIAKAVADIPRTNSTVNTNSGNTATTTTSTATTSAYTNTTSGGSVSNMGSGSATLNNISTVEAPVVITPAVITP
jgi:hypothetical protein